MKRHAYFYMYGKDWLFLNIIFIKQKQSRKRSNIKLCDIRWAMSFYHNGAILEV